MSEREKTKTATKNVEVEESNLEYSDDGEKSDDPDAEMENDNEVSRLQRLENLMMKQQSIINSFIAKQTEFNSQILLIGKPLEVVEDVTNITEKELTSKNEKRPVTRRQNCEEQGRNVFINNTNACEQNISKRVYEKVDSGFGNDKPIAESTGVKPKKVSRIESMAIPNLTFDASGMNCNQTQEDQNAVDWRNVAATLSRRSNPILTVEKPLFRGHEAEYPPIFLKRLEKYFIAVIANEGEKLVIAKSCFVGDTASWISVYEDNWETYREFKVEFLNHFWSGEKQFRARNFLNNKKYFSGKGTMASYFLNQVKNFRIFQPPIPEDIVVNEIMRQFPSNIQAIWAVVDKVSVTSAYEFLQKQITTSETSQGRPQKYDNERNTFPQKKTITPIFDPKVPPPVVSSPYKDVKGSNDHHQIQGN